MVEGRLFSIYPVAGSNLPPFDALVVEKEAPPQPPTDPGTGEPRWHFVTWTTGSGWIYGWGPFPKPRPIGNAPEGGKWQEYNEGWFYQLRGPMDKPSPGPEPPPDGGGGMPDAKAAWEHHHDGWYFAYGPVPKPVPPPGVGADNPNLKNPKWEHRDDGWYFVAGPYDKPIPIGPIPQPPDPPVTPPDVKCKWVYTPAGWVFCIGPFDKPQPPHLPQAPGSRR